MPCTRVNQARALTGIIIHDPIIHQISIEQIEVLFPRLKTANVLNKVPKPVQPKVKEALQDIWMADSRVAAYQAFDACTARFEAKYPKAMECLHKDKERLLAFYDFPRSEEHTSELQSRGHLVCRL